jgi:hypothetical protein
MLDRNDWVTPVFNAELRTHKPVLLYWLMMSAYAVFGVNEFAARFWSAVLAVGTALCTYLIGRRLFNARAGLWAGVIVSTSLMFQLAGRAATPDSPLIFFITLALTIYVLNVFPAKEERQTELTGRSTVEGDRRVPAWFPASWCTAAALYGAMGFAVLTKGPVGLVMPAAVIGMFLLIQLAPPPTDRPSWIPGWLRPPVNILRVFGPLHFLRTCWIMRPFTAIGITLAVALPWYLCVGARTDGEFLRGFFLEHNLGRATQTMEGHSGSVVFYPAAILVGFFPWSVFAAPVLIETISRLRRRGAWTAGHVFAACWVGVFVALFSLAKTKLPSYVTPCYPALALLTGYFLDNWVQGTAIATRLWLRLVFGTYILVGLVMATALPVVIHQVLPGEQWLGLLGLIPLAGGIICFAQLERSMTRAAAITFAGSAAVFILFLFAVGAVRVASHQRNHVVLEAIDAHPGRPRVASFGCLEPSWVFYGRRPIEELTPHAATWVERNGRWVRRPSSSVGSFLESASNAFIITRDDHLERLRGSLPPDYGVVAEAPHFLRKGRLVLIGVQARPTQVAADRPSDTSLR